MAISRTSFVVWVSTFTEFSSELFVGGRASYSQPCVVATQPAHAAHDRRRVNNHNDCHDPKRTVRVWISKVVKPNQSQNVESQSEHSVNHRCDSEGEEEPVVSFSNAGPDPGAVVVVDFDACAAVATVEGARRSVNVACTTLVTHDWFSFHHGDVVNLWLFFINCDKDAIEFFLLTCLTSPRYDPRVTERGKKQERQTQAHCHTVHTVQHSLPGVLAIHYSYLQDRRYDNQCPCEE